MKSSIGMNRRRFILRASAMAIAAAAPILWHETETHRLQSRPIRVTLGLQRPLRIAALGDIHFDPLYEEDYLSYVASCLTELQADLIVYTGDFITHQKKRLNDLAIILSKAKSRLGAFATLGNHDHWSGATAVTSALDKHGIRVLRNECFPIPDEDRVYLSALDSFWAGSPDPIIVERTDMNSRHILLVHEPDSFLQLTDSRIRLQISGHTHGGQVRIPMVGALLLPKWGHQFQQGLYVREGRYLYVNRGIGTLWPHVRVHCPPEITVLELS